ncbi:MAG: zeta toxin family protein [Bifidobacteriaceae bacterium]|jgi:hypothetical protein|nr:zeta toxin family protein [Bifidobacteriaceae bacterium]
MPLLVLLGGQPAAGKTYAQETVIAANPDAGLVPITGDDLREYHPDYARLAEFAPLEMPGATAPAYHLLQHDAAALIPIASTTPNTDTQMLWREHHEREAALARAIPAERTRPVTTNRTVRVLPANQPPPPVRPQDASRHDPPGLDL